MDILKNLKMQAHIDALCFKHRISRFFIPRYEVHTDSSSDPLHRNIKIADISDSLTYWVALHEIGHIVDPFSLQIFNKYVPRFLSKQLYYWKEVPECLRMEARAWIWAFDNSLFELDEGGYSILRSGFSSYIKNAMPDDHPEIEKVRKIANL